MSCTRLSLFTNVTREPAATVTERGDTPLDVMVMVAPEDGEGVGVGVGVGEGELGVALLLLLPQDTAASTTTIEKHRNRGARSFCIRGAP